jgi:hypothetical protein
MENLQSTQLIFEGSALKGHEIATPKVYDRLQRVTIRLCLSFHRYGTKKMYLDVIFA